MRTTRFAWVLGTDGAAAADRILRLSFWSIPREDAERVAPVIDLTAVRDLRRATPR